MPYPSARSDLGVGVRGLRAAVGPGLVLALLVSGCGEDDGPAAGAAATTEASDGAAGASDPEIQRVPGVEPVLPWDVEACGLEVDVVDELVGKSGGATLVLGRARAPADADREAVLDAVDQRLPDGCYVEAMQDGLPAIVPETGAIEFGPRFTGGVRTPRRMGDAMHEIFVLSPWADGPELWVTYVAVVTDAGDLAVAVAVETTDPGDLDTARLLAGWAGPEIARVVSAAEERFDLGR